MKTLTSLCYCGCLRTENNQHKLTFPSQSFKRSQDITIKIIMNSFSVERQGGQKKRLNIFQDQQKDFWWEHFTVEYNILLGNTLLVLLVFLRHHVSTFREAKQEHPSLFKNFKPTNPFQTVDSFIRPWLLIQKL